MLNADDATPSADACHADPASGPSPRVTGNLIRFAKSAERSDPFWRESHAGGRGAANRPEDVARELAKIDRVLVDRPDLLAKLRQRKLVACLSG